MDNVKQDTVSGMTNNINQEIVIEDIHKNYFSLVFESLNMKQISSCDEENGQIPKPYSFEI